MKSENFDIVEKLSHRKYNKINMEKIESVLQQEEKYGVDNAVEYYYENFSSEKIIKSDLYQAMLQYSQSFMTPEQLKIHLGE